MSNRNTIIYSSDLLIADSERFIPNGSVITREGIVIFCGTRQEAINELRANNEKYTELYFPAVMTPGLINAHTHLQYTGMAAIGKMHFENWESWIKAFDDLYLPLSHGEDSMWKEWALDGALKLLESGTTAAAEVLTDKEAGATLHNSGLHGIVYREVMKIENSQWYDGSENRILNSLSRIPKEPGTGLGPHATYSMGSTPLKEITRIAKQNGFRTHIHVGEAPVEAAIGDNANIDSLVGFLHDSEYRDMRLAGDRRSAVKYLDELGVLYEGCHIAHGIYVNEEDREILRKRNTVVALCPRSNAVIGLDEAPIAAYLKEGNPLALGTDSLSSSPSLDLLDDAALFYEIASRQGYIKKDLHNRLFEIITKGGAEAIGKSRGTARYGDLCEGSIADIAYFDVNKNEPLSELLEAGGGRCIATIISGEKKFEKE